MTKVTVDVAVLAELAEFLRDATSYKDSQSRKRIVDEVANRLQELARVEHPHAVILRAIADGRQIQMDVCGLADEWVDVSAAEVLANIPTSNDRYAPDCLRVKP